MKGSLFFTDVRSSSKLWAAHPKEMNPALIKHENHIRKTIGKYDSLIVKVMGDAFMIKFAKLTEAIQAAIELQQLFAKKPIMLDNDRIQIRIGIAYGEFLSRKVVVQEHKMVDYFGPTVNIASRMESKVSPVGGFAFLGEDVPPQIFDQIAKYCNLQQIRFKYKCEKPARSERLIQCRDVAELDLEDGKEHLAFSATLKD